MSKVELSEETQQRLLGLVRSFDDTPEIVIQRLLDHYEDTPSPDKLKLEEREPPREGEILPEGQYWLPILEILVEAGDQAEGSAVIDALESRIGDRLRSRDRDQLKMGEVRWRNRARFARLRMKELGLISNESPRGIWEITERGRDYLRAEQQSRAL
ncbi:MAG: winged helix-turn-helix domain-containing protein [Solirubrobacterales bacterium]